MKYLLERSSVVELCMARRKRISRFWGFQFSGSYRNFNKQIYRFNSSVNLDTKYTFNSLDFGFSGDFYIYSHKKINVYSTLGLNAGMFLLKERIYSQSPYATNEIAAQQSLVLPSIWFSASLCFDYQFSARIGAKLSCEYLGNIIAFIFGKEDLGYNAYFPQIGLTFNLQNKQLTE